MSRAVISLVDPANAPEDVRKAAEAHLAKGYRITTMAMFMIGNNYFNDILRVQSEFLTPASETNGKHAAEQAAEAEGS